MEDYSQIIDSLRKGKEKVEEFEFQPEEEETQEDFLNILTVISYKKWHVRVKIIINDEFILDTIALFDIGANLIKEGYIHLAILEAKTKEIRQKQKNL